MDRDRDLMEENEGLRKRLQEAEELIDAIRNGRIDAVVVSKPGQDNIYTLKGADHTYRVLIETMDEGAVILSKAGAVLYCNRSFAQMLDIPVNQVTGKTVSEFVAVDDQDNFQRSYNKVFDGDRIQAELNLQSAGKAMTPALVSLSPFFIDELRAVCMVVTDLTEQKKLLQDITERKRSEEALRLSERKFRGLSMYEDEKIARSIIEAGAETYLPKTASPAELFKAISGRR